MFMPMMPMLGMKPQRRPNKPAQLKPQATLYIRNLNEKIKLDKLKKALETIFGQFGKIIDIRSKRNLRLRGQAFVSFDSIEAAKEAMEKSQGFPLFEKPMDIQYANEPSIKVQEMDGKVIKRVKVQDETLVTKKKKRTADDLLPPNALLFVQNLPEECTEANLTEMFKMYPGFKEVRLIPGKNDICFVEYEGDSDSVSAKQSLHGYRLYGHELKVTYARK